VELAESRVAVIDIGGHTTDVLTFRDLSLTPTYGSVERGVLQVKEDINKEIKHRFNRHDLDPRDLDVIMKPDRVGRYYYRHAGMLEDVTEIVEEAVWELTTGVLNVWTNQLRSGVDYDVVVFTGGGAPVIRPFLETRIQHGNILRVDDRQAHLANAIGAWRFAAFRRTNA
jgi:cell division ATPase FtsA